MEQAENETILYKIVRNIMFRRCSACSAHRRYYEKKHILPWCTRKEIWNLERCSKMLPVWNLRRHPDASYRTTVSKDRGRCEEISL